MNIYKNLSLKWRPNTLEDFQGHNNVIKIIVNMLKKKKIHSTFLFYGPRGVGKTTLSRLLSKGLNCLIGVTSNPCGKCINCINIALGKATDVIEIDAASRTKVEDTRDLLDRIYYLPIYMRYKVYIIDEIHMLSKHSFNALLKTLEETPDHVKFILATTELQKIPDTILSRCMSFYLKSLSFFDILDRITYILIKEKISYDLEALKFIASYVKGSIRDALIFIDQLLLLNNNEYISIKDINSFLNILDEKIVISFLKNILIRNKIKILKFLKFFHINDIDYLYLLNDLLKKIHNIFLICIYKKISFKDLDISFYAYKKLLGLVNIITLRDVKFFYKKFLSCKKKISFFPDNKRIIFEFYIFYLLVYKDNNIKYLNFK